MVAARMEGIMAVANTLFFNGEQEVEHGGWMNRREYASRFPDTQGIKASPSEYHVGHMPGTPWRDVNLTPVTRVIDYKKNPSLHKCDARCMNARGRSCECSCGGKNHGINA